MGSIDLIIIGIMLFFLIKGFINGLIIESVGILGVLLAFLCSFMLYTPMSALTRAVGLTGNVASVTAYILAFILIYVIVIIIGKILQKALTAIYLGWLNRLLGLFFGGLKGAVILSIILWIVVFALPHDNKVIREIQSSALAKKTMLVAPYAYNFIGGIAGVERANPFRQK